MIHTSDIYFQKALAMQHHLSTFIMTLMGIFAALVPVLFSFFSITETVGTGSSSLFCSLFTYSAETTVNLQIGMDTACLFVFSVLGVCMLPLIYLELKYREYKRKYIHLQVIELAMEYVSERKWHSLSLDDDKFEQIFSYLAVRTFFSAEDILNSLYIHYGDVLIPLLEKHGWAVRVNDNGISPSALP